ncbi:MAG: hypothetical protein HUU08_00795 [Candidatus Brocadia sp.]|nr:hypothetical protein [Candidatus Brocadia sp.]
MITNKKILYDGIIQHVFNFLASPYMSFDLLPQYGIPNIFSGAKKATKFFNGRSTQGLGQPDGNGGREKNIKKRATMYFFVIFHGISVQSNGVSKGIRKKSLVFTLHAAIRVDDVAVCGCKG